MKIKREGLVDYMLFSTTYQDLAECFKDKEKFIKLWNNVLNTMVEIDNTSLEEYISIKDIPTIDEMLNSKYFNSFLKAIDIIKGECF